MTEKSTAELSQDTWRFFNQRKRYLREPLGDVIERFVKQLDDYPAIASKIPREYHCSTELEIVSETLEILKRCEGEQ